MIFKFFKRIYDMNFFSKKISVYDKFLNLILAFIVYSLFGFKRNLNIIYQNFNIRKL